MTFVFISVLLMLPYGVLLMYYHRAWTGIPVFSPVVEKNPEYPFVSVIISARNEAQNIRNCLTALARQTYPKEKYEVIVINDHSEDDTAAIIKEFVNPGGVFKLIELAKFVRGEKLNSYKKKAIETGISLSKGELIMTTDADCVAPPDWIFTVASYYKQNQSAMIASPVAIAMPEGATSIQKFFYAFQILDFITLQGITGAALYTKFHYMANGANLAYPKTIFIKVEGFKDVDKLASGDDMFLMEKVRALRPENIHYLKSAMSTVTTYPEKTLKLFFNQRIRWASKSGTYRDYKIKMVLALVYAVNVWSFILLLLSFYLFSFTHLFIFIAVKILFELLFLLPVTSFFQQRKLLFWFIPFQPFHIIYIILAGWLGSFGSYNWKGRRVQ